MAETLSIEGRTVVVTGAASGIGFALARCFVQEGANVLGLDINGEGMGPLARDGALTVVADVADSDQVKRAIAQAAAETGRVDVLVNNAGIGGKWPLVDVPEGKMERAMAVNAFGTFYAIKAVFPHMRRQGHGRIISILSRAAEYPWADGISYTANKAAQWAFTAAAAYEVGDADILVNGQIPGPTNTPMWGRDMPQFQPPEAVYPTTRMLATLPAGGPNGKVFWDMKEYLMFHPDNDLSGRKR